MGGKVALEIFVTHSCEPDKVKAFESHNIPILEVKISDSIRFRKELNKQPFTPEDLEDYFEKLRARFSQQVFEGYLDVCRDRAKSRGIDVFNLNFNEYASPLVAFAAEENRELVATLEGCRRKTLVIFEGADALAPLECNETFWLRSAIVAADNSLVVMISFEAKESYKNLLYHRNSPFYMSAIPLRHELSARI